MHARALIHQEDKQYIQHLQFADFKDTQVEKTIAKTNSNYSRISKMTEQSLKMKQVLRITLSNSSI